MEERKLPIGEHLEELRQVLTVSVVAVILATATSYFAWGEELYELVVSPLHTYDVDLVYIGMAEALLARVKLAVLSGLVLALPVILWKVWGFIAPALFPHERRFLLTLIPLALLLFGLGTVFAYLLVFKFVARFLLVMVRAEGLVPMLSIGQYISFLVSFLIPFGLVFELPLVVYFLARIGLLDHRWLSRNRKFALLVFLSVSAVLTPPDVISQILLTGPMALLYEVGVVVAWLVRGRGG